MVFEYLTVLISVVVGLSLASFLTNIVRIIHVRGEVKISWVQLMWAATILIWTIDFWWFTFVFTVETQWSIGLFSFVLAYSVFLFLLMALLFPEGVPPNHDYRTQFMRNRRWFFSVLLIFLFYDLGDYFIKLEKGIEIVANWAYVAFIVPLIVLSFVALSTQKLWFHRIFAVYGVFALLAMTVLTMQPLE